MPRVRWPRNRRQREQAIPCRRRHRAERDARDATEWPRNARCFREPPLTMSVTIVAAEQLVAAVTRQGHRDMLAGELAHEVGRNLRWVGMRLIVHLGETRYDSECVRAADVQSGM